MTSVGNSKKVSHNYKHTHAPRLSLNMYIQKYIIEKKDSPFQTTPEPKINKIQYRIVTEI